MTSQLLRGTLRCLQAGPARAGLRRAAQQWCGGPTLARGLAASRLQAAAAVVEAPEAGAAAPPPHDAPVAYRAFVDFKFVRDNVDAVAANARNRLSSADPHLVASLYEQYVAAQQETDKLRAARNENSSAMKVCGGRQPPAAGACRLPPLPPARRSADTPALGPQGKLEPEARAALIEKGKAIKEQLEGLEAQLEALEEQLQREGQRLPNMTHPGGCWGVHRGAWDLCAAVLQ